MLLQQAIIEILATPENKLCYFQYTYMKCLAIHDSDERVCVNFIGTLLKFVWNLCIFANFPQTILYGYFLLFFLSLSLFFVFVINAHLFPSPLQ